MDQMQAERLRIILEVFYAWVLIIISLIGALRWHRQKVAWWLMFAGGLLHVVGAATHGMLPGAILVSWVLVFAGLGMLAFGNVAPQEPPAPPRQ